MGCRSSLRGLIICITPTVLLVLVTIALYWPATSHDFVNYDDPDNVSQNAHVLAGLKPQEQIAVSHAFAVKSAMLMSRLGAGCADD